jgi:hypothetical protein
VICGNKEMKDFEKYFAVSKSGIIQTLDKSNITLSNCLIYVEAFNG